jgi:hypothetical protein
MIAVRPGLPAWQVLALVVAKPGQLDAEAIGQALWRPKFRTRDEYFAARAAIVANGASWTTRASDLLHRLQQRGLVERMRPPRVATRWADLDAADAADAIEDAAGEDYAPDPSGLRAKLLADLVRRAPATVSAWVGAAPAGNVQRCVTDLVEWGLVVPPSFRWPTAAGTALIRGTVQVAAS